MTWNMEAEEVEGTLEKIWDLHDRISDAIHAVSRAHFLNSVRAAESGGRALDEKKYPKVGFGGGGGDYGKDGYVFVKGFKLEDDAAAFADVRSLNGIRTALEDLEDQIEFFHVKSSLPLRIFLPSDRYPPFFLSFSLSLSLSDVLDFLIDPSVLCLGECG